MKASRKSSLSTKEQITINDVLKSESKDTKFVKEDKDDVTEQSPYPFRFIDLFAGIGGIRLAFESIGGICVFSSEWDEQAAKTYEANFNERPAGDITKIDEKTIPDFEVLLAGFPCQPFSIIGDKEGFSHETQGTLFFDIERILKVKHPPAFMLENVRNLIAHKSGRTFKVILSHLEALGYHVYFKVLNALDFGVPQKRERIFICGFLDDVSFEFPQPIPRSKRLTLADILEPDELVDKQMWVNGSIKKKRFERMKIELQPPYITHENVSGNITPHHYSCALRAGASANYILINNERRPTARELLRLQGFPETFRILGSYSSIRKQIGNSVAVPVVRAVANQIIKSLRAEKGEYEIMDKETAKKALDSLINKARAHFYKPIQVAEILFNARKGTKPIDLLDVNSYRNISKEWRNKISKVLVDRVSTSSMRYQDDLFNESAIPPAIMNELGKENNRTGGAVEAYIYRRIIEKLSSISKMISYVNEASINDFQIRKFIELFECGPGLKRSMDKVYEVVVYSLFSTLVSALELDVTISIAKEKRSLLTEFSDFAIKVMCLDVNTFTSVQEARIFRVGVTNAADRGIDMYANWGPAIQVKHLSLDEKYAEEIVGSIESDRIVIVCKDAEEKVIGSVLNQIGFMSRIQSIITESDLEDWYNKALRGNHSNEIGKNLLKCLHDQLKNEFPSKGELPEVLSKRKYDEISDEFWQ